MRRKRLPALLCLLLAAALLTGAAPRAGADAGAWHYAADFASDGLGGTLERYLSEKGLGVRSITIGWRDPESGEEWYLGADVFSEGASTYKLPLCMLFADRVAEGSLTREDKLGAWTVDQAVREALVRSSNNAADVLRHAVSDNQVVYRTAIAQNCGLPLEELPSGYYTANQFSPRYLIGVLQTLYDHEEKYGWLIDYMKQAQPDSFFSRWRGGYEVAHKTGNALGYICDTGIVYAPRPFLLTAMCRGVQDADRVLGEIARITMDYAEFLAERDGRAPGAPTPTPAPTPAPAAAEAPAAEPEARQLAVTLGAKQRTAALADGRTETACLFGKGETLAVSADEEIGALYLVWHDRPQPWTLEIGGERVSCGEQGFLHEFVALPRGARELTIRFPEDTPLRLAELRAYSPGVPDGSVQRWQPPCEQADILLVPTHADDEFIFFGGLIPLYAAERGARVQTVYTISHYGSLRERCHEMLDALWYAGIRNYPVVNTAPDREIYSVKDAEFLYGKDSFTEFLTEQIRRFRPLVIVTHDEHGEYRQGNHIFTAQSMEKAVVLAADAAYQPESAQRWGVWDTPKTYLHLYGPESERTVLDYETPLASFGGKTAFTVAEEAFALHASQQTLHFRVYESGHAYDSHSFGLYRSLVGADTEKNDLMENLAPAEWRK